MHSALVDSTFSLTVLMLSLENIILTPSTGVENDTWVSVGYIGLGHWLRG